MTPNNCRSTASGWSGTAPACKRPLSRLRIDGETASPVGANRPKLVFPGSQGFLLGKSD
jgi:hypothetical protein